MSRISRRSTVGLLLRHLSAGRAASVVLTVLVGVAVLVIAIVPRAVATLAQNELHHELTELSPLRVDLTAVGRLGWQDTKNEPRDGEELFASMDQGLADLRETLGEPFGTILGEPEWFAQFPGQDAVPLDQRTNVQSVISLALGLRWEDRVHFTEGAAPTRWAGNIGDPEHPASVPPIEIAISAHAATLMGLRVGDLIDYEPAPLLVSGVYEPIDPGDNYWLHALELRDASVVLPPGGQSIVSASVYLNPLTALAMEQDLPNAGIRVWYPAVIEKIEYADATELLVATKQLTTLGESMPNGEQLVFTSSLADAIGQVVDRISSITALLALNGSAPLGVVIAVLILGTRTVLTRRQAALALIAARGATSVQLRATMLLEGAIIALPVGAAAIALAAVIAPARVGADALVLPLIVALLVPALCAATAPARLFGNERTDLSRRANTRFRWIVEAIVLGGAALALFLLVRRGLVTSSASLGLDPLLAATPLLLSLAACVLVLRGYPVPLLALQRSLRRRRGAVGLLGAARAVRDPVGGFAVVLAIVVAVSSATFSLIMSTTVNTGLASASHELVGADIRVEAANLSPAVVGEISARTSVRDVVAYDLSDNVAVATGFTSSDVKAVFADLDALSRVRPDLALGNAVDASGIPFFASPDLADRMNDTTTVISERDAVRVGVVPAGALPGTSRAWILVDERYAQQLTGADAEPDVLLVTVEPGTDVPELAETITAIVVSAQTETQQRHVKVMDSSTELAVATSRPSTAGLSVALLVAAVVSLLLGVLAIVLGTVAATGSRNRLVGVLRLLGMTPGQVRRLVAWELAPVAIAAVAVGTALGFALAFTVTEVLDLRPFVGGTEPLSPSIPAALIAVVAIGFAGVVLLAGFVAVAAARRINPATTVKMGAE